MINTNSDIRKVAINGPINERKMSKSNFLITNCFFVVCCLLMNDIYLCINIRFYINLTNVNHYPSEIELQYFMVIIFNNTGDS